MADVLGVGSFFDPSVLSDEVWFLILQLLPPAVLVHSTSLVCRYLHRLSSHEGLWRALFCERFPNAVLRPSIPQADFSWRKEFMWRSDTRTHVAFFNASPALAINALIQSGFYRSIDDLARFLHTPGIAKWHLGTVLSMKVPLEHKWGALCNAYLDLMDLDNLSFVDALRKVSREISFPGEAGYAARMLECIAKKYWHSTGGEQANFVSEERMYMLATAALMLNTDAHNPLVKKKMSCKAFVTINHCPLLPDLTEAFLKSVYLDIQSRQLLPHSCFVDRGATVVHSGWLHVSRTTNKPGQSNDGGRSGSHSTSKSALQWVILTANALYCCRDEQAELHQRCVPIYANNLVLHAVPTDEQAGGTERRSFSAGALLRGTYRRASKAGPDHAKATFDVEVKQAKFHRRTIAVRATTTTLMRFVCDASEHAGWTKAIASVIERHLNSDWHVFALEHGLCIPPMLPPTS